MPANSVMKKALKKIPEPHTFEYRGWAKCKHYNLILNMQRRFTAMVAVESATETIEFE